MVIRPEKLNSLKECLNYPEHVMQEHKLKYLLKTIVEEFSYLSADASSKISYRIIGVQTIVNELQYLQTESDLIFDRHYTVHYEPEFDKEAIDRDYEIQEFLYKVVEIFGLHSKKAKQSSLLKPEAHIDGIATIVSALNKLQIEPNGSLEFEDRYRILFSYY